MLMNSQISMNVKSTAQAQRSAKSTAQARPVMRPHRLQIQASNSRALYAKKTPFQLAFEQKAASARPSPGVSQSQRAAPVTSYEGLSPSQIEFMNRRKTEAGGGAASYVAAPTPAYAASSSAFVQPARVVTDPLPNIYVYDHCPFCVRVRLALGLKNIKHNVVFMMNDDVATPMNMLGKKIAPILEIPGPGGIVMGESMDIINYFDKNPAYGPTDVIKPASGRADLKAWQKSLKDVLRLLHRPRYMMAALPEFAQKDSCDFFVYGHALPPYEKQEWKENLSMEQKWGLYEEAYASSLHLLPQLNTALDQLENLIHSKDCVTEGGLSLEDIDLWARLRSVTLVKGARFGPKTTAYLHNIAELSDSTLYFNMAC